MQSTLNLLVFILAGIQICDILISTALYFIYNKNRDYLMAILMWIGMSLFFFMDYILGSNVTPAHPLMSYVFAGLSGLSIATLISREFEIHFRWKKFLFAFVICYLISLAMYILGVTHFTLLALPISLGVITPVLYTSLKAIKKIRKKERKAVTSVDRIFLFIMLIWGLHFLDYPFLRPLDDLQFSIFGFSFALVLTYLTSILIPVVLNKRIYLQLNRTLEAKLGDTKDKLNIAQSQIMAREKLALVGTLTAGIAHEIKNPLNIIKNASVLYHRFTREKFNHYRREIEKGNFDALGETLEDDIEKLKETADIMEKNIHRADRIVKNMLIQSRVDSSTLEEINLSEFIKETYKFARDSIGTKTKKQIDVQFDFNTNASIQVYSQDLSRALINLIENSLHALNEKTFPEGELAILKLSTFEDEGEVIVKIFDNGVGIKGDVKNKVLEPFFTTKPLGEGTGLGLSMASDIMGSHQGSIDIASKYGEFTEITLKFPKKISL